MPDRDTVTNMDLYKCKQLIRELNAKELQRKWKKFLKEQEKHGHKKVAGNVKKGSKEVDSRAAFDRVGIL
jgi:hypothetical protein